MRSITAASYLLLLLVLLDLPAVLVFLLGSDFVVLEPLGTASWEIIG